MRSCPAPAPVPTHVPRKMVMKRGSSPPAPALQRVPPLPTPPRPAADPRHSNPHRPKQLDGADKIGGAEEEKDGDPHPAHRGHPQPLPAVANTLGREKDERAPQNPRRNGEEPAPERIARVGIT